MVTQMNPQKPAIRQSDWQYALNIRACPPDPVLFGAKNNHLERHIRSCYMCRQNLQLELQETWTWPDLGTASADKAPATGQIRRVSTRLAGWGPKNRYYNPPLLLILDVIDDQAVQVAQMFPDEAFFTNDDIAMEGFGFAQPWNTYTMAADDLEGVLQRVSSASVEQVLSKSEDFFEIDENSYLFLFRQLETEIGSFFSQLSLAGLLEVREDEEIFAEAQNLVHLLRDSSVELDLDQTQDPLLTLALTDFSNLPEAQIIRAGTPEPIPVSIKGASQKMAAADTETIPANLIVFDITGVEIQPELITILAQNRENGQVYISGKIGPESAPPREIYAWWKTGEKAVAAERLEFSSDKTYFDIEFSGISREDYLQGQPLLLIVGNLQEGA